MSLMADLLARVRKSEKGSQEIPPQLRELVGRQTGRPRRVRWALLAGLLSAGSVIGGLYLVSYLEDQGTSGPQRPARAIRRTAEQESVAPVQAIAERARQTADIPESGPAPTQQGGQTESVTAFVEASRVATGKTRSSDIQPKHKAVDPKGGARSSSRKPATGVDRPVKPPLVSDRIQTPAVAVSGMGGHDAEVPPAKETVMTAPAPGLLESYLYAGRENDLRGDPNAALENYLKALELRPKDPDILNRVAYMYLKLGRAGDSLEYSEKAAALRPGFTSALVNAGIACMAMGSPELARGYLVRAVEAEPANRNALLNLGLAYEKDGNHEEAMATFRRLALTGDPEAPLHEARLLEKGGLVDEAVEIYEGVLRTADLPPETRERAEARIKALSSR